jgi:hypothetical protein
MTNIKLPFEATNKLQSQLRLVRQLNFNNSKSINIYIDAERLNVISFRSVVDKECALVVLFDVKFTNRLLAEIMILAQRQQPLSVKYFSDEIRIVFATTDIIINALNAFFANYP